MAEPIFSKQNPEQDKLMLNIDDDVLARIINQRIGRAESFCKELNLKERQDKNKRYLYGDQINLENIPNYSKPYMENVIWEAMTRNSAIAISRLPDLLAKQGNNTPESVKTAKVLTDMINSDIRRRKNKKVMKMAYQHRKVFLFSVIKVVYNRVTKTYEFENIHPQSFKFDHTPKTGDVDKMAFVSETRSMTVEEIVSKFPAKKELIFELLGWRSGEEDKYTNMATVHDVEEVWFDENIETTVEGEKKWQAISGVAWMFKNKILHKMRNPYWDWEGEPEYFKVNEEENKKEALTDEDVFTSLFGGLEERRVFKNHFKFPRKPYFMMTFNEFGEHPIDISTDIEQVIYFQDHINDEGRMISDINRRSAPKNVFSSDGLSKKTIEDLDTNNPNQSIIVDGDLRQVHTVIQTPPAPRQLYDSKSQDRSIAFEIMALNATTRGVRESGDETLGAKQMMREQDFGVIDDEVDDTINAASEWMASWSFQMIKMFYSKDRMISMKGKDGGFVFERINSDLIEDGMEVIISASGVDKQRRRGEAFQMAQMKLIDPYNFFKDIDVNDPEGRTRDLILFNSDPTTYMQNITQMTTPEQFAQEANMGMMPPMVPPQQSQTTPQQPPAQPPQE